MQVEIVAPWPDDDAVSEALRQLTKAIHDSGAANGEAGGLFGGSWGYGADYENDVFLMHRYCWCEQEDCPWCGGCSGDLPDVPHRNGCYQIRLLALKQQYGRRMRGDHYDCYGNKLYDAARDALCAEMNLDPRFGSEVHCTCGAVEDARRLYDACECDWHKGRAQFRFGPARSAPHFWHKASGLQVRWYKYIGRSMKVEAPPGSVLADIMAECEASLAVAGGGGSSPGSGS